MVYNIFLSHSWRHAHCYDGIIRLLDADPFFRYRDLSVPEEKALEGPPSRVWSGIYERIRQCSVFIFPSGVHASHSESIQREIEKALEYNKPILAVRPWAAKRTSNLEDYADEVVGWNSESIIQAIRRLANAKK